MLNDLFDICITIPFGIINFVGGFSPVFLANSLQLLMLRMMLVPCLMPNLRNLMFYYFFSIIVMFMIFFGFCTGMVTRVQNPWPPSHLKLVFYRIRDGRFRGEEGNVMIMRPGYVPWPDDCLPSSLWFYSLNSIPHTRTGWLFNNCPMRLCARNNMRRLSCIKIMVLWVGLF